MSVWYRRWEPGEHRLIPDGAEPRRRFSRPVTIGGGTGLLLLVVGGLGVVMWRRGRDVRFRGSQVDQVMGGPVDAETQAVAVEKIRVELPRGLRPGQVGTLIAGGEHPRRERDDRRPAVRKYLVIEEIPKTWMLGKADWNLRRLPGPEGDHLLPYEEKLRDGLFEDGDQV
jgi:hypothetical protein